MSEPIRHVEMYDGRVFCRAPNYDYSGVDQGDWHESPTALTGATCVDCLRAIFTLGGWAQNALSRIPGAFGPPPGASSNPPAPRKR